MKVLQLGKNYPPAPGGIEALTRELQNALAERGCTSDVLCFAARTRNTRSASFPDASIMLARRFAVVWSMPLSWEYLRRYRAIRNRYDVVHVHMPNPLAVAAVLLCRCRGAIVLQWHSDIIRQHSISWLISFLIRRVIRRASMVIGPTSAHVEESDYTACMKRKTRGIPYLLNSAALLKGEERASAIRARFRNRKIVLAVGRLVPYKGFDILIRAAAFLPRDVVVLIVGIGRLASRLDRLISQLGLGYKVILLGHVATSELSAYFRSCDVFCLPSVNRSEMFGLVQLEAMAFGKPVVSTRIPRSGVHHLNQDGRTGFTVAPGDPVSLSAGICQVLADPDRARRLGEAARERFIAYNDKAAIVEQYLDLYRTISPTRSLR